MIRLAISGVLLLIGSLVSWVYLPEITGQMPVSTPIASLRPENSPGVHLPSQRSTEAPGPSQTPPGASTNGPLPSVALEPVPTVIPQPSFVLLPTERPTARPTARPTPSDGCYSVPKTPNTPTGIAGCIRFGTGTASFYSQLGLGAAMNFCTWTLRHGQGCGSVTVTALSTGISVRVPIVDFCDCYTGTADERIIDLQGGLLPLLGLNPAEGLFRVRVQR
jgi:hypothetical protein